MRTPMRMLSSVKNSETIGTTLAGDQSSKTSLKTAKRLRLDPAIALLALADEAIE
jgi:hypothetical protein